MLTPVKLHEHKHKSETRIENTIKQDSLNGDEVHQPLLVKPQDNPLYIFISREIGTCCSCSSG